MPLPYPLCEPQVLWLSLKRCDFIRKETDEV